MIPLIILAIENDDDRDFMIALYNQYNRLMYSEARKIVENDADAEDVVQDVFTRIIEKGKIPLLRSLARPQIASYVVEASKNCAKNLLRRKVHSPFVDELLEDVLADDEDVERNIMRLISMEELRDAMQLIKEEMRDLLIMKYYLFMDNVEIGQELGLKPGSVRMKLTRARREVLRLLNDKQ